MKRRRHKREGSSGATASIQMPDGAAEALGVVLVDAPQVVRAALGRLMAAEPDLDLLLEADSADECLTLLRGLRHGGRIVAVVGLGLFGEHDSFWLIRSIRESFPTMPVIATGRDCDDVTISKALFVGADSFVNMDTEPHEFIESIRRTGHGEVVLAGVPDSWLGKIANELEREPSEPILTPREIQVLEVASEGYTARQIGSRLGLRERTVTTHLGRIYKKLGVDGRIQAITQAVRAGLVPPRTGQ